MSLHHAQVSWTLGDGDFRRRRYSRLHTLSFAAGIEVVGSASPSVVPKPWASDDAVDPEAAFTAALSACHMLTFLDLASRAGFVATAYCDRAEGELAKNPAGKMAVTRVTLRPQITWAGEKLPDSTELDTLHHAAHELCFIANSVLTEVVVEAV